MNGENFPNDCYIPLDLKSCFEQVRYIDQHLTDYCRLHNIDKTKIQTNTHALKEIVTRIDQRKLYFHIFHNRMHPNEYKMTALLIYWVLKLRPFWIPVRQDFSKTNFEIAANINDNFCVYLFLNTVRTMNPSAYKKITAEYLKELAYSFRFRDLSKESIYLIFDALNNF